MRVFLITEGSVVDKKEMADDLVAGYCEGFSDGALQYGAGMVFAIPESELSDLAAFREEYPSDVVEMVLSAR